MKILNQMSEQAIEDLHAEIAHVSNRRESLSGIEFASGVQNAFNFRLPSNHLTSSFNPITFQMQKLKHQNIIQFYGIVFGEPTMLIIEFCDGGSLLDRLRNTKKPVLLVTKLLSYALQIGLSYNAYL